MSMSSSRVSWFGLNFVLSLLLMLSIGGCASMVDRDPVRISVVGMDPLPGAGMEVRFGLKLRVQNPNDDAIEYDGVALELELNGKNFASGVSDAQGSVPRYGEALIVVPVTVSAISFVRTIGAAVGNVKVDVSNRHGPIPCFDPCKVLHRSMINRRSFLRTLLRRLRSRH